MAVSQSVRCQPGMIRYAAYGSNLHPIRLTDRIPSTRLLGTSFVPGWSLKFHKRSKDGSGKCNILQPGDGVHIAVYEMRKAEKQELDEIEGLGKGYEDASIVVPEFGRCSTYLGSASHVCNDLAPFDWYKEMVLLGCRKQERLVVVEFPSTEHAHAFLQDPDYQSVAAMRHAATTSNLIVVEGH